MQNNIKKLFLGVDTSNYTTSLCLVDQNKCIVSEQRRLLPVAKDSCGLRQSDALFHHTSALPCLSEDLFSMLNGGKLCAVGCSKRPRDVKGSYMPCFLAGVSYASGVAHSCGMPLYDFSHQAGHIKAAVCTSNNASCFSSPFISYHVSGGTTEILLTEPDDISYKCKIIGGTNDLNAGQAIDRTGVAMGLLFPCGKQMDALALESEKSYTPAELKVSVKNGFINLSGLENMAKKRIENGEDIRDVCKFVFIYLSKVLRISCEQVRKTYGNLHVLFAGGVMSNSIIRSELASLPNVSFADSRYSSDNAYGIACLCADAYMSEKGDLLC